MKSTSLFKIQITGFLTFEACESERSTKKLIISAGGHISRSNLSAHLESKMKEDCVEEEDGDSTKIPI